MSNSIFSREEIEKLRKSDERAKRFGKNAEEIFLKAANSCKNGEINNIKNGLCFKFDSSRSIFGPEKGSVDLTPEEKKIILGRENDEGILEKQLLLEKFLVDSICAFYGIEMDELRVIRQYKDVTEDKVENEVEEQDKKIYEKVKDKIKDVNNLFDKCARVFNNEKLEDILKERQGETINKQTTPESTPALKDQIANMTKVGEEGKESYEVTIKESKNDIKNYIFSDPKTILQKYITNSLKRNNDKIKYYNKDGAEIKFADEENDSISDDDYKELFDEADKDASGDTANDIATKENEKSAKKTMVIAICKFYGKSVKDLKKIIEKEKNGETLPNSKENDEQGIFNLFNECKSILNGEKNLVESKVESKEEGKDKKTYYKIEKMAWTNEAKKQAVKGMSKNQDRKNLNYENLSFEELDIRLKDLTGGRSFDQIIKEISNFVHHNKHNDKLRLNDALFGTGKFTPGDRNGKEVKRKLRATVWFKKIFAKENDEYPLNENDPKKKTSSVLKPNERKSHIVDMARGTFDACLRRMIHLAPKAFAHEDIGISLKKKEGHFARNLGKIRFFSDRWIRESFDLAKGARGDTSFFSPKQTKKSFFRKITDVYLQTPELQKALKQDEIKIEEGGNATTGYKILNADGSGIISRGIQYNSERLEIPVIDKNGNITITKSNEEVVRNANIIAGLQSENARLQDQLDTVKKTNEKAEEAKQQEIDDAVKKANEKAEEAKQQEIKRLKEELNKKAMNKKKDKEIATLKEGAQDLQQQIQDLKTKNETLQEQADAAEAIEKELNDLKNGKANLDEQNNKISEILSKYQGEQQGEQKEIKITAEDFNNLKNCLAAMGIAQQTERQ